MVADIVIKTLCRVVSNPFREFVIEKVANDYFVLSYNHWPLNLSVAVYVDKLGSDVLIVNVDNRDEYVLARVKNDDLYNNILNELQTFVEAIGGNND